MLLEPIFIELEKYYKYMLEINNEIDEICNTCI